MDEKDIWRSAQAMIDAHGEAAKNEAVSRAAGCYRKGDLEGAAVWRRIIHAIGELQDTTPGSVH